ncbi:MAG TPA: oxygenase MpaB family protein [Gemmatimonadaceae bacterium]
MRIPVEEPRPLVTAPATPLRFHDLERARAAHGHRADILAPAMLRADPLADAAVESFTQLPAGRGVAMLNAALAHGIDSVTDAPESLIALFRAVDEVPMWVDWDELAVGGDALMRTGMLGLLTLMCYSLPMAYAVAEGNKPLTFSGRLMGRAARRLNETGRFVIETCRPGGLRRDGDGFRITIKVRLMHAQVRRLLLQSARWKTESWGTPINQADMAATNVTFSAVVLRGLRRLGVRFSARESAAVMSLWRYSGHLSGVEPDLLCATEGEGVRLAELMWMTRRAADDDSRQLVQALMACKLEPPLDRIGNVTGLLQAMTRSFIGDALADELQLRRTRASALLPLLRGAVATSELARIAAPPIDRWMRHLGARTWELVVTTGLTGRPAEFQMPASLTSRQSVARPVSSSSM